MTTVTYTIPNINCKHCIHTITTELSDLAGVSSVEGDLDSKLVTVYFDAPATQDLIVETLADINYPPA